MSDPMIPEGEEGSQKFFGKSSLRYVPRVIDKRGVAKQPVAQPADASGGLAITPGATPDGETRAGESPVAPLAAQAPPHPFMSGDEVPMRGIVWRVMETRSNGAMVLYPVGLTAGTRKKLEKKGNG